ncbi:MAG: cobalamin B12-binding domain-containing protein [Thermodesulfovibrionales bacterium]
MQAFDILRRIIECVKDGDIEGCASSIRGAILAGIEPLIIVDEGLSAGLREVGEKFGKGEMFLPDLMMAVEAMREGMRIVEPELKKMKVEKKSLGKVVIGTVAGDIHDIGKSIVATMLELNGYTVIDLGVNVSRQDFIGHIREQKPQVLGMSALLSTTMREQREVIEEIKKEGLRDAVKIIVGGAPVSGQWADEIGADGYGANADLAVQLVRKLIG